MNSNEYIDKLRQLTWLQTIVCDYKNYIKVIKKGGEHFTIETIIYSCRGPGTPMRINPHRSIKAKFILDALTDAIRYVEDEVAGLKSELKSVTVELATPKNE